MPVGFLSPPKSTFLRILRSIYFSFSNKNVNLNMLVRIKPLKHIFPPITLY